MQKAIYKDFKTLSKRFHIIALVIVTLFLSACNENWGKGDFVYPTEEELRDPKLQKQLVYEHNQLSLKYKIMEHAYGFGLLFLIEVGVVALYLYHINVQDKKRKLQAYAMQVQEAENVIASKQHEISGLTYQMRHGDKLKLVDQIIQKTEPLYQLKSHPQKLNPDGLLELEREVNRTFDDYEKRLAAFVPTLTDSELALCSLIKVGLSVKDIATVICIEPASVSRRKLRIKDKVASVVGAFDAKRTIDQWLREF